MKKHLIASITAIILSVNNIAFAADFDWSFEVSISREMLDFCDCGGILLFGDNGASQALDYSKLDNFLTVEVADADAASGYSLVVVEYDENDLPQDVHIINDVEAENVIGNMTGEYEKAFLWDFATMQPACPAISTKTDYEIIEGADGDWSVSPDGHMLYAYFGEDTDVVIPNSYHGKRITSLCNQPAINATAGQSTVVYADLNIFCARKDITSFVIPEGIERIGPCAFSGCEASCELILPSTLKYIGNFAFINCKNLTGSLNLSTVTTLKETGGLQFANCTALDGTLTLPSVEIIPKYAFYNCRNLTGGINIPNGVKRIEEYAFSCADTGNAADMAKFTALTLPASLEWIGKAAFQNQKRIANELILPEGLKHIGDAAFNHCGAISNTVLTIPASLESIGGDYTDKSGNYVNTGYGCHVFYDAFRYVTRFEVAAGSSYFKAVDGVLYSKDGTRLVVYPYAKTGDSFTIPEGVTQIDEMAFGYSKFTTLTLPDSYVISETVPENVINNKANTLAAAMYHYNSLQNVLVKPTNPNYISVDGIIYSADGTKLWYVPPKRTGKITVESGCTEMMSGCCWMEANNYNGELYTSIYIPETVSRINANTLSDLNRKIDNGFTINLDSENGSFVIQNSRIVKKQ